MMKIIRSILLLLLAVMLFSFHGCESSGSSTNEQESLKLVNLSHLNNLYEETDFLGIRSGIIHIYSEYPDYKWVDAGGEGITCVDDIARAAVVYLEHFKYTGDTASRDKAKMLLKTVCRMQGEDGLFYNFILSDHSINKTHKNSLLSFNFWAVRAIWAMSYGMKILQDEDKIFCNILKNKVQRSLPHVDGLLKNYDKYSQTEDGLKVPEWLIFGSAGDATSVLLLGLGYYYELTGGDKVKDNIIKLGDALIKTQVNNTGGFPDGAFLSWKNIWHAWGNVQSQALGYIYSIIPEKRFLDAVSSECDRYYPEITGGNFLNEWPYDSKNKKIPENSIKQYPQIAYGIRPIVGGLLNNYNNTKKWEYARLAGEFSTWLFGNNSAGKPLYDPLSGRCFDGINGPDSINRNSGAESTIEALLTLLYVESNPVCMEVVSKYIDKQ